MQNTNIGNRNPSKSLHNISDQARESGENIASDLSSKASRFASDTAENASEYYDKASSWVQQNYGKTLGIIGFIAAIGTIGFLIGKSSNKSEFDLSQQR